MNPSLYLHGFNLLPQFGPRKINMLWEYFHDWEQAFYASYQQLQASGIDQKLIAVFNEHKKTLNLEAELEKLEKERIKILTTQDINYPFLLKQISDAPPIIYYKGFLDYPDELAVAVVGTRKITNYGRTVAPYLVEPLIECGATIVSGLAFGVDAQMHQLAINKSCRTIAVLGGGLDQKSIYPKQHLLLSEQIIEHGGALLSEYPLGTPPLKQHFVARNRIISGLCLATIIVECNLNSGSLITAKYALEQNRQLFAVPGPIYADMSKGPNNLIKMGAKAATCPEDVLEDLNLKAIPQYANKETHHALADTPHEQVILSILTLNPMPVNELIQTSGLTTQDILSTLTFLEMKGRIKNLGAQQYIKIK